MSREPDLDFPVGVEQRCIEPGHWLIEGYDVLRVRRGEWRIGGGGQLVTVASLRQAREWIVSAQGRAPEPAAVLVDLLVDLTGIKESLADPERHS